MEPSMASIWSYRLILALLGMLDDGDAAAVPGPPASPIMSRIICSSNVSACLGRAWEAVGSFVGKASKSSVWRVSQSCSVDRRSLLAFSYSSFIDMSSCMRILACGICPAEEQCS